MRHYEKPTVERIKLLVKEDIAYTRTTISGINDLHNGNSVTTYNSTDRPLEEGGLRDLNSDQD